MSIIGPVALFVVGLFMTLVGVLLILNGLTGVSACIAFDDYVLSRINPWRTQSILVAVSVIQMLIGTPLVIYGYLFLTT